jgi:hypothetical protein
MLLVTVFELEKAQNWRVSLSLLLSFFTLKRPCRARSADSFRAVILGQGFVSVLLRLVSTLCLFALFSLSDSSFAAAVSGIQRCDA